MSEVSEQLLSQIWLKLQSIESQLQQQNQSIKPVSKEGWMSAREAAEALKPEGILSHRVLQDLRLKGVFSEARGEIRNVSPNGNRPTWQYHSLKCKRQLQKHFSASASK
jgi:hypothetical protein